MEFLNLSRSCDRFSKFWQEANYNFVYLNKIDRTEWDNLYRKLILEVQETENDYEYYRLLQRFCSFLKDGHTNVYFPRNISENISSTEFGEFNIQLSNIEGKAIVTGVNKGKKEEIPIGSEIVKVNGLKTRVYLTEKVIPNISSSTEHILEDWGTQYLLEGYMGTRYEIEFLLLDQKVKNVTLTIEKSEEEIFPTKFRRDPFELKWIDKDIAYIALNTFSTWETSGAFYENSTELQKAKKLIIDLRENGGGDTPIGLVIFQSLTNDTLMYGSKSFSRKHIPTFKAWGRYLNENAIQGSPDAKKNYFAFKDKLFYEFPYYPDTVSKEDQNLLKNQRIVVPTVILIGHNIASAAEDFLIFADKQSHMTKIGEPTFGSTGQPYSFELPGGGSCRICTKEDTYPDGREFVGIGIQPDILVSKSLEDYLTDKDPVMEKAIEFLKSK
ncbi:S41 family peptidase [Mongoliibacter ruber]|uniref:C-terminal processing protease CtpA/Prc n=1 Tax=Mongoliibacter ruber TaxID=1750599 RepID=A0A2T0WLQ0_9BACT|nr:S41 family peptidase [Mongoliibacter ruber]PRY87617.1 C-terminal processing protease CtpA/Prc [Mongoliibacter ruber]